MALFQRSLNIFLGGGFSENTRTGISKPLQQGQQRRGMFYMLAVIQLRDLGWILDPSPFSASLLRSAGLRPVQNVPRGKSFARYLLTGKLISYRPGLRSTCGCYLWRLTHPLSTGRLRLNSRESGWLGNWGKYSFVLQPKVPLSSDTQMWKYICLPPMKYNIDVTSEKYSVMYCFCLCFVLYVNMQTPVTPHCDGSQ